MHAAGCRLLLKTTGVFGDCDCGGEVVVLDVETVSRRGVVDRRVLTADVGAGLGLMTCVSVGGVELAGALAAAGCLWPT